MTPRTRIIAGAAVSGALALSLAGSAAAGPGPAGTRTFEQTFPLASKVCAKVAAGTENKHLKAHAAQVTADCATLQEQFTGAQATVNAARAAILPTLAADRAAVKAACPKPESVRAACRKARKENDAVIRSLRHQWRAAVHTYYKTIEADRRQFWAAVRSLPHEKHIKADAPIPVPGV